MRKVLYILGNLADEDVEWLTGAGERIEVAAGQALIQAGVEIDTLYIILSGGFDVLSGQQKVTELNKGEMMGEMSFIESFPPSVTVKATTSAHVLSIPHHKMLQRMEEQPIFAARIYRAMAQFLSGRLRATMADTGLGAKADLNEGDELDLDVLDGLNRAGERFERILKKLGE